jgi:putative flippase GtrA
MSEGPRGDTLRPMRLITAKIHPGGRVRRLGRFGLVGLTGIAVNEAALALLVSGLHLRYLAGYLLATQFSTVWNFGWIEAWAFKSISPTNRRSMRFASLLLVNNAANLLTAPLFLLLTVGLRMNYLVANLLTLAVIFLLRFLFAERIWTARSTPALQDLELGLIGIASGSGGASEPAEVEHATVLAFDKSARPEAHGAGASAGTQTPDGADGEWHCCVTLPLEFS